MKVLHLATSDHDGGAGIAALRLHASQMNFGVDSKFLCLRKSSTEIDHVYKHELQIGGRGSILMQLLEMYKSPASYNERMFKELDPLKDNFEIFTSPFTEYKVHLDPLVVDADIIHLHWVANFINYPSFFKNVNKPLVWTLHDFNPDQGGLHLRFEKAYIDNRLVIEYEKELARIKRKCLINKNIAVVCPSKWLYDKLSFDVLPQKSITRIIPHGIDHRFYKPHNKERARQLFHLKSNDLVLVCIAQSFNRSGKGFNILISALDKLALEYDFTVLAVGRESSLVRPYLRYMGVIDHQESLAMVYSSGDAYITSSLEESFCLTAAEALSCGLPVISTPVGFMADMVQDGFNGYLAEGFTVDDLYKVLVKFINSRYKLNNERIAQFASESFSMRSQYHKYQALYDDLVNTQYQI